MTGGRTPLYLKFFQYSIFLPQRLDLKHNLSPPAIIPYNKMGCVLQMVSWSEFRIRQYRDNDNRDGALHFTRSESSRLQGILFEIEMSEAKNIAFLVDFQT